MLVLRATQRFGKHFSATYGDEGGQDGSFLGPWYVNLMPEGFKDIVICVNERTRLAVLVELRRTRNLDTFADRFRSQLGNLLLDLGIAGPVIGRIMDESQGEIRVTRTQDRSMLGTMNDFASMATFFLEDQRDAGQGRDCAGFLHQLNDAPLSPLDWDSATMRLRQLCGMGSGRRG